ncbi:MAG: ACP S-malonyltransferase [Buchnera aphidicola (Eriosoma harunire)]
MEISLKMNFAIIFPGQGSCNLNNLNIFTYNYPKAKKTFDEASHYLNYDLWKLIKKKNIDTNTYHQYMPAILLTISISIYRLWNKNINIYPNFIAGHSLGEYTALVCSQCISFHNALNLVIIRNELMKKSMFGKPGLMAAIIGLDINTIFLICKKFSTDGLVTIASINSESEIIITGHKNNVYLASLECKKQGAKAIFTLTINIASHCSLMQSASIQLSKILKNTKFNKPKLPIINNVDIQCEYNSQKIKNALIRQLIQPINWRKSINFIISKNISILLEIGINKILTNLNKSINNVVSISLHHPRNFKIATKTILQESKIFEK